MDPIEPFRPSDDDNLDHPAFLRDNDPESFGRHDNPRAHALGNDDHNNFLARTRLGRTEPETEPYARSHGNGDAPDHRPSGHTGPNGPDSRFHNDTARTGYQQQEDNYPDEDPPVLVAFFRNAAHFGQRAKPYAAATARAGWKLTRLGWKHAKPVARPIGRFILPRPPKSLFGLVLAVAGICDGIVMSYGNIQRDLQTPQHRAATANAYPHPFFGGVETVLVKGVGAPLTDTVRFVMDDKKPAKGPFGKFLESVCGLTNEVAPPRGQPFLIATCRGAGELMVFSGLKAGMALGITFSVLKATVFDSTQPAQEPEANAVPEYVRPTSIKMSYAATQAPTRS